MINDNCYKFSVIGRDFESSKQKVYEKGHRLMKLSASKNDNRFDKIHDAMINKVIKMKNDRFNNSNK